MADPKYIRLAAARQLTMVADVLGGTGWSISGADVKPFPENDREKDYVRNLVRSGVLEPCSKAEYEEVQERNKEEFETEAARAEAARALAVARAEKAAEAADEASAEEEEEVPNTGASAGGLPPSEPDSRDVDDLSVAELRQRLSDAGEPTSGNKAELQERLRALG